MNLVAFGLILICCNAWAAKTKFKDLLYAENGLEDFLKKLKTTLKTGNESLGIPVLDPFHADRLQFNVDEDVVKLDAILTNVNANGLSEYDIVKSALTLLPPSLDLHLSWPFISLNTDYSVNAIINGFNIYGKGAIKMSARGFAFDTNLNMTLEGGIFDGHVQIQDMKLKLSLKSLDLKVTGLFNDDDLSAILSAVISDMAPNILNNDTIVQEIIKLVKKYVNTFLCTKKLSELMKLLYP
ncbi:PREDICTED: uncharacterized protein LOC105567516 [Vollenhovia emeryi]|uniref:uncharacterized protein LOC105567516 n=1 Tax=Vollenhovia emeryi TaxID=411798 RepID=UPI0005F3F472|nr:PREDICTED: uncharacterized protein LOC105567516 [Vollenhovia emeryi]